MTRTQHALDEYHKQVSPHHTFHRDANIHFQSFNDLQYRGFPTEQLQKSLMGSIARHNTSLIKQQITAAAAAQAANTQPPSSSSSASIDNDHHTRSSSINHRQQLLAHHHAICSNHASSWLTATPTCNANLISNLQIHSFIHFPYLSHFSLSIFRSFTLVLISSLRRVFFSR